jgi:hypothetical protein
MLSYRETGLSVRPSTLVLLSERYGSQSSGGAKLVAKGESTAIKALFWPKKCSIFKVI